MSEDLSNIPAWLMTPPMAFPSAPATTRAQKLPFGKLYWENFERLCARLERTHADIESCRLYGTSGQAQEGIDLYSVRRSSRKYRVLQCKRVEDFTPGKIKSAVEAFLTGSWATRSETFVLCTKESLRRTERIEEIERQRSQLRGIGVEFETWDSDELDSALKNRPEIVTDFFGYEWAKEFCGAEAVEALRRLDGIQVAELRTKLRRFYQHVFDVHDPGPPVEAEGGGLFPLKRRYVIPDVYQEHASGVAGEPQTEPATDRASTTESEPAERVGEPRAPASARSYRQRRPWTIGLQTRLATSL